METLLAHEHASLEAQLDGVLSMDVPDDDDARSYASLEAQLDGAISMHELEEITSQFIGAADEAALSDEQARALQQITDALMRDDADDAVTPPPPHALVGSVRAMLSEATAAAAALGLEAKHDGFGLEAKHDGFGFEAKHDGFGLEAKHDGLGLEAKHDGAADFAACAARAGCAALLPLVESSGLARELPALGEAAEARRGARLTFLAPSDAALRALPPLDAEAARALLSHHVCAGALGAEGCAQSLGGMAHAVQRGAGGELLRVGGAAVLGAPRPFAGGQLVLLDAVLLSLVTRSEARPEQVWRKRVQPAPEVTIIPPPPADAVLEIHAKLIHRATGATIPDGLRGHVRPFHPAGGAGGALFNDLVITHQPSSASVKKKVCTVEQHRMASNTYVIAYSIYDTRAGCFVGGLQTAPLELRNSYHTLSEAEKEYRRGQQPAPRPALSKPAPPPRGLPSPPFTLPPADGEEGSPLHDARSSDCASPGPSVSEAAASDTSTVRAAGLMAGPPQLIDISTDRGPAAGGTMVWVQGANLSGAVRVMFGDSTASEISVCSPELLKCKSPPHDLRGASERTVPLRLIGAEPTPASLPFTYFAVKGAGGRRRVDAVGAADGAEAEGAARAAPSADEQALKVRLVSVLHRIEAAYGAPPADAMCRALLAARDACGWGVLHLLAALEWLPLLALALHTAGCPAAHRDGRRRSPLQVAVARNRLQAAALLLLHERRTSPDWRAVWVAVAAEEAAAEEEEAPAASGVSSTPRDELDVMVARLSQQAQRDLQARRLVQMDARVSLSALQPPTAGEEKARAAASDAIAVKGGKASDAAEAKGAAGAAELSPDALGIRHRLLHIGGPADAVDKGGAGSAATASSADKEAKGADAERVDELAERRRRLLNVMSRHSA
ncbi:hypothetical protein AB1Y20_000629 [Prymnesium parvum]|uniref:FAS1 domain-containing protein n=1 Tax=Prymnesium parvum TaxID=97485 RepID=A0AB34KAM2_PRYPA